MEAFTRRYAKGVTPMNDDERAIRNLVDTWISATRAGDIETVLDLIGGTPDEMNAQIKADVERWTKIIRDAGIEPQ